MESADRERRRRKILDRGADRLALITGQIPNTSLPISSPLPDSLPAPYQLPSSVSPDEGDGKLTTGTLLRDHKLTSVDNVHGDSGIVEAPLHEQTASIQTLNPPEHQNGIGIQAMEASVAELDVLRSSGSQLSLHASTVENLSVFPLGTEEQVELGTRWSRQVTFKEITYAIAEMQRTRLFCTVLIAVFVMLSNWGFPLLGCYPVRSMIRFRPLYLVLLTNVTLVGARLLLDDWRGSERASRAELEMPSATTGEVDWVQQASKALEASLLMQKAMDAFLLDFSVYIIIVVCGLSFSRD